MARYLKRRRPSARSRWRVVPLPLALLLSKLSLRLTRALHIGGGSAFPGLLAESLSPGVAGQLTKSLKEGSILITGTNGKTTTAMMLRQILEDSGKKVVGNPSGSNLLRGINSALVEAAGLSGSLWADIGVFEVVEAAFPGLVEATKPVAVIVLDLFRDQLDRYGELDTLARLIGSALAGCGRVYLNADDPMVASLARFVPDGIPVSYFGVDAPVPPSPLFFEASDSDRCPLCDRPLIYEEVTYSHLGRYRCREGHFDRPRCGVRLTRFSEDGRHGSSLSLEARKQSLSLRLPLPGLHNAYNALAAFAVADCLGLDLRAAASSLAAVNPAFGRGEVFQLGGRELSLLLAKNPTSFNQTISTYLVSNPPRPLLIAVNDLVADGTDVSWLWDVAFEVLRGSGRDIVASGTRCLDLALRLKYADVGSVTVEADLKSALDLLLDLTPRGAAADIISTYTATLGIRRIVAQRVSVRGFWRG